MSDDALGAQTIQQQRSTKEAAAEKSANRTTTRNPKPEGDTQGDHPRGQARISDGPHVTNWNLKGESVWNQGETCEDIHGETDEGIWPTSIARFTYRLYL